MNTRLLKSVALDLVGGFLTLVVVVVVAVALHTIKNATLFLLFAATLLFIAGMLRSIWSRTNPWVQGMVVSTGASVPVVIVGKVAFGLRASLALCGFVVLVVLVCGAGAQAQKFWKGQRHVASVGTLFSFLLLVFLTANVAVPRLMAGSAYHTMDKLAPDFTLAMLDGTPVTLESLRGHVVVLDFWGTWCVACVAEMPALRAVQKNFQGNKDVIFIAVNPGWSDDTPEKIRNFVRTKHLDIPVALASTDVAKSLNTTSLPWLVVLDRQGHIRMENSGYANDNLLQRKLTEEIERLLPSS
ncbi:MAG TPA: TlpA disulfide reductase family protein [Acidobacteriaceae bacterium]|nr:TlpA disulfide reductase family protein [Acidobacteriaceae bacterium]